MYVWDRLELSFKLSAARRPAPPVTRLETGGHHTDVTVVGREFEATVRLTAKTVVADGVVALTLESADRGALPPWTPGAHVDLVLPDAPTRQYSLCGDPGSGTYRLRALPAPRRGGGAGRPLHPPP